MNKRKGDFMEVKDLNFSYDGKTNVINNVSFSLKKGAHMAILGASGSGKSTLLRIISNILSEQNGYKVNGEISIFNSKPKDYLMTGKLSFMFQSPNLMPNLNVRENIIFPLKLRGQKEKPEFIDELLNVVGLENHQEKYPIELSGGMKTRTSLARAFATKPELLLLDEPFSALDIAWRYDLYEYLEKFSNLYKTTIILVTHDIQESVILGDQILVLSKGGRVLASRKPIKNTYEHATYFLEKINGIIKDNQDIILQLQNDIILDSKRQSLSEQDRKKLLEILNKILNKKENKEDIETLYKFRNYVLEPEGYEIFKKIWKNSNSIDLKTELIWFLTDNPKVEDDLNEDFKRFIQKNWNFFKNKNKKQEYFVHSLVLDKIEERIKDERYPETKNWLYWLYGLAMSSDDESRYEKIKESFEAYKKTYKDDPNIEWVEKFLIQENEK